MSELEIVESDEIVEVPSEEPKSFEDRQRELAELLKDPEMERMAIAGIYIFMQDFDAQMRGTFQMMQGMGGPRSMLKMLFGKGGTENE